MSNNNNLIVNGMMKSPTSLECGNVSVNGMFKVAGDLNSKDLSGDGMIKIESSAHCDNIDINGVLKVKGEIFANDLKINGVIKANSINGEDINISGKMSIEKNINCERLIFNMDANSEVENIEGSSILIKNKKIIKRILHTQSISADEIIIENVKCITISGDKVIIGPNCDIKNVEYKTSIEIHPSSKIQNSQKL